MPDEHTDPLSYVTRAELYELAQRFDVEGRSSMNKVELHEAISQITGSRDDSSHATRFEQFRQLAAAAAAGHFVMLPRILRGDDRRRHVRQTLREDHETRIADRDKDADEKFDKLAGSLYSFFRGTALLFYRDMAGQDAWMPTVLTLGDVHPENFGVMPNANNVPIFSVNDFDEATYAPFTWDLKRGTVGFMIAAQECGGYGKGKQRKIARRFVEGYVEGIRYYAENENEQVEELRLDNSPPLIHDLLKSAQERRADWLEDDYLDEFKRGFRSNGKLVPVSDRREEFEQLLRQMFGDRGYSPPERAGELKVKDVAVRKGQGTASLGLPRYYVLIEGPLADGTDDLIVEFKQARRSALAGLVPPSKVDKLDHAERIVQAHDVQLVRGDLFYGSVTLDGLSFLTRERAPYRDSVDLDELSKKQWKEYARICGRTLAHVHALSDETGDIRRDIEPEIVEATKPNDLFVEDMVRFASESAERVRRDHKAFRKDHALGAFKRIDIAYR